MKPKIVFFAILSFVILSFFTTGLNVNAEESNVNRSYTIIDQQKASISGELKYVRVLKAGKWWIYVFDGNELVDIFPE